MSVDGGPDRLDSINAETAHRVGYAVDVCEVENTVKRAIELAEEVTLLPPLAVASMKRLVHVATGATFENGLAAEGIPPEQVVGSSIETKFEMKDG